MFRIIGVLFVLILTGCATVGQGGVSDYRLNRKVGNVQFATVVLANGLQLSEINGERVNFSPSTKIVNLPLGRIELKVTGNLAPGIEGGWEFTKPLTVAFDAKEGETWLVHLDYTTSVIDRPKSYVVVPQNVDISGVSDAAKLSVHKTSLVESRTTRDFDFKMLFVDPMVPVFIPGEQSFLYAKSGKLYLHKNGTRTEQTSIQVSSKHILFVQTLPEKSFVVIDEDGTVFGVERDFSKSVILGKIPRPIGIVKSSNANILAQTSPNTIDVYDENLLKSISQIHLSTNIQSWDVAEGAEKVVVQSENTFHIFDILGKEVLISMPALSSSEQLALSKPKSMAISHDGNRIALLDFKGNIWVLEIDAQKFQLIKQDELLGKGATPVTHGGAVSWGANDNSILLFGPSYALVYDLSLRGDTFARTYTDSSGAEIVVEGDGGFSMRTELGGSLSSNRKAILIRCKSLMGDNYLILSTDLPVGK